MGDNRQHSSMIRAWALGCSGGAQAQDAEAEGRLGVQLRAIVTLAPTSLQVVRSALRLEKGREVVMFWYLESIEVPEKPHGLFGVPWHLRHLDSLGQRPQASAALPSCTWSALQQCSRP